MQVLTDVQKRDGTFELGTIFYTQTVRKKDATTKGDKRWFIHLLDIIKKLKDPRVEKVSKMLQLLGSAQCNGINLAIISKE